VGITFLNWIPGPISKEFFANYSYNDHAYALEDSIIENISKTIIGKMEFRITLSSNLFGLFDYLYKNKIYQIKSEQDPDY